VIRRFAKAARAQNRQPAVVAARWRRIDGTLRPAAAGNPRLPDPCGSRRDNDEAPDRGAAVDPPAAYYEAGPSPGFSAAA